MEIITTTLWLTIGLTFYSGDQWTGNPLYCGGIYTETEELWGAVPIEWLREGYVGCGDLIFAEFADRTQIQVRVKDAGCHLHWPAYGGGGQLPYGADFPRFGELKKTPTGVGKIAVLRKDGSWWEIPPLDAWATDVCEEGPLTGEKPEPKAIPDPVWPERYTPI